MSDQSPSPNPGVSPEFLQDVTHRVSKLRHLSEAGGVLFPSDLTLSVSKLRNSVMQRDVGYADCISGPGQNSNFGNPADDSLISLSFASSQYSNEEDREEARSLKYAREQELKRLRAQSHRLKADVQAHISGIKTECGLFVEQSARTSFELSTYRQEIQRMQASIVSMRHNKRAATTYTGKRVPMDTSPRLTPDNSVLEPKELQNQVRDIKRDIDSVQETVQSLSAGAADNSEIKEMIKRLELSVDQTETSPQCKLHCNLL